MNLKMNQPAYLLIAVLLIVVIALMFLPNTKSSPQDLSWFEVKKGNFIVDLIEEGEIKAIESMFVKAPYEWRADLQIIDMVPEGTMVEKGDFLLQLDTGYLEAELGAATSQLETNQAELRRLKAEQEARMTQFKNDLKNAQYSKEVSKLQLEKLKYESESRKNNARLNMQKSDIALKEAGTKITSQKTLDSLDVDKVLLKIAKEKVKLEEVNRKLAELTLHAPISGLVVYYEYWSMDGRQKYKIGDKAQPGQAIIEIPDLSKMEVVFNVHEIDRDKVEVGQEVDLILEAFPEKSFQATITEIARLAEASSGKSKVKLFKISAAIKNNDIILKPGMTAKVQVLIDKYEDVLKVPCTAVFEQDGEPVVFLSKKWPDPAKIKLGPRNNQFIIVESGLKAGDKVAWQVPFEHESKFQKLGYAQKKQLEMEETEKITQSLEEMKSRGLDFDYAHFRENKGNEKQSHTPPVNEEMKTMLKNLPDAVQKMVLEKKSGANVKMMYESSTQKNQVQAQVEKTQTSDNDSSGVKKDKRPE